jgi:hypothetical protein
MSGHDPCEPHASNHAVLAGLCRECHHAVTIEPASPLAIGLQCKAIDRAARSFTISAVMLLDDGPTGAARYIERHLGDRGEMEVLKEVAGLCG